MTFVASAPGVIVTALVGDAADALPDAPPGPSQAEAVRQVSTAATANRPDRLPDVVGRAVIGAPSAMWSSVWKRQYADLRRIGPVCIRAISVSLTRATPCGPLGPADA
jgi:hypothetical protein